MLFKTFFLRFNRDVQPCGIVHHHYHHRYHYHKTLDNDCNNTHAKLSASSLAESTSINPK